MTRDEILNTPAGERMNQQIWWKIFDMTPMPPNNDMKKLPDYSGNETAVMGVIEKFQEVYIEHSKGSVFVMIGDNFNTAVTCETMPLAVCRAALLCTLEEK